MSKSRPGPARPARPSRPSRPAPTRSTRGRTAQARPRPARSVTPPPPASFRHRHPVLTALVPVALVMVALVTMIVIKTTGGSAAPNLSSTVKSGAQATAASDGTTALPAGALSDVTSVSSATLATVARPAALALPAKVSGRTAVLKATDGKPDVVYIGAEFCPFCAAERWAMVEALSRFGTFTGLRATHSATHDSDPDTQTFSFYGSTYTSPYLDFTPVEEATNQVAGSSYATLQTPTAAQQALLTTYDVAPYTDEAGSIPFLDIGNRYLFIGASYNPKILAGLSLTQIAADLDHPTSTVAQAIDGTANEITASICAITGNQPASVCDSPTIAAIAKQLAS
jgi:Domain of unknown function (DUF929)